jgi:hypothetical protein
LALATLMAMTMALTMAFPMTLAEAMTTRGKVWAGNRYRPRPPRVLDIWSRTAAPTVCSAGVSPRLGCGSSVMRGSTWAPTGKTRDRLFLVVAITQWLHS